MRRSVPLIAALVVVTLATAGCARGHLRIRDDRVGTWTLRNLPPAEAPYWSDATSANTTFTPLADKNGVVMFKNRTDQTLHYHPTVLAQWALKYLTSYRQTKDPRDLELAEKQAAKLIEIAEIDADGVMWFAFDFDFPLHGRKDAKDQMIAPWYSGMTQGQALSTFSRLYEVTGKAEYLDAARRVAASFDLEPAGVGEPWTVRVDEDGYYWVSEYPSPGGDTQALNGFIFGLFGLYDYWAVTGDARASELLRAGVLTVKDHYALYRQPGGLSLYCLAHRVTAERYHRVHVQQFAQLSRITGDAALQTMSDELASDYAPGASKNATDMPFTEGHSATTSRTP